MINIQKILNDFTMWKINKKIIYFDNASTTFNPNSVIKAINYYYMNKKNNSSRGNYDLCYQVDQTITETRKLIAILLI